MTTTPPSVTHPRSRLSRMARFIVLLVLILFGLLVLLLLIAGLLPIDVVAPLPSNPVTNYDDALAQFEAILVEERETPHFNPVCHSILMSHGEQTEHVVVFYHGFTNCPEQYRELGEAFFDLGYNVYIPLAPYHGRRDRLGLALRDLTAEDLAAHATTTADIAQGLGRQVTVSGLSGGGSIAAWLAQERADVALAAPVSPFIGVRALPGVFLNRSLATLLRVVPNVYTYWDPITRENNPNTAPHAYVGYPLRSMGTYMQLGFSAKAGAAATAPRAAAIRMVLNAADLSVSNRVAASLVDAWQRAGATDVDTFTFGRDLALPHDLIAPERLGLSVDDVYPALIELLTGAVATGAVAP